jgi:hypothetical protein
MPDSPGEGSADELRAARTLALGIHRHDLVARWVSGVLRELAKAPGGTRRTDVLPTGCFHDPPAWRRSGARGREQKRQGEPRGRHGDGDKPSTPLETGAFSADRI